MKKLFTLIVWTLFAQNTFAQLTVVTPPTTVVIGKVMASTVIIGEELSYSINGTDTTTQLLFWDTRYPSLTQYSSITFKGGAKTVTDFYNQLSNFFTDDNKAAETGTVKVTFTLGDNSVTLSNYLSLGIQSVMITTGKGTARMMTKKQVNKLFGKQP